MTWDKNALYFQVPEGKKLIGDSGYKGELSKLSTSVDEHSKVKEFFARAKSGQETINTRLKSFNILSGHFRHGKGAEDKLLEAHQRVFEAVCVLVQYDLRFNPLMEI